jgi:hypothetical protein
MAMFTEQKLQKTHELDAFDFNLYMTKQYSSDLKAVSKRPAVKALLVKYSKENVAVKVVQLCAASAASATRTLKLSKRKLNEARINALEECIVDTEKEFKAKLAKQALRRRESQVATSELPSSGTD